jgi:hypothetical protein
MTAIMIISTDDVIIGTNSDGDAELEITGDTLKLLVGSTSLSSLLVDVVSNVPSTVVVITVVYVIEGVMILIISAVISGKSLPLLVTEESAILDSNGPLTLCKTKFTGSDHACSFRISWLSALLGT